MTDFLVVGGGIAGLSTAAALAPHGSVTVLEAEAQLGYHASGRSAAMFLENYGNATVRALNGASLDMLRSIDGCLKARGMMLLGRPDERDAFVAEARDFGLEEISFKDAKDLVPILRAGDVAFAAQRSDVFDLDTDMLMQHFRRSALRSGARIETGARVDRIARDAGGWHLSAGDRVWSGTVLVNAAGAWADVLARMAGVRPIGLQPYRRSMARIALPGGLDPSSWPFMDGVGEAWYAKPDAGAMIVSPADEDPVPPQDAWADDMVLAEGLERYQRMVTAPVERLLSNWAGLRTFAPDRALVIGRAPDAPTFLWCAGQGGYGFQTCCAASGLLRDIALDRPPALPPEAVRALDPARFG